MYRIFPQITPRDPFLFFFYENRRSLASPGGNRGSWRDLRKDPVHFKKRTFGGGNVMVWGAFSIQGCLPLVLVSSKMKSSDYVRALEESLVPFLRGSPAVEWTFQQDNARIHVSRESLSWFTRQGIQLLTWPACSPDLNPMENLWGVLSNRVYQNNKQYNTVRDLKTAIFEQWGLIQPEILRNLILGMDLRMEKLFQARGNLFQ